MPCEVNRITPFRAFELVTDELEAIFELGWAEKSKLLRKRQGRGKALRLWVLDEPSYEAFKVLGFGREPRAWVLLFHLVCEERK